MIGAVLATFFVVLVGVAGIAASAGDRRHRQRSWGPRRRRSSQPTRDSLLAPGDAVYAIGPSHREAGPVVMEGYRGVLVGALMVGAAVVIGFGALALAALG